MSETIFPEKNRKNYHQFVVCWISPWSGKGKKQIRDEEATILLKWRQYQENGVLTLSSIQKPLQTVQI